MYPIFLEMVELDKMCINTYQAKQTDNIALVNISGTIILMLYLHLKIWYTHIFHLQVSYLQMSCRDLTKWEGTRIIAPTMAPRWYALHPPFFSCLYQPFSEQGQLEYAIYDLKNCVIHHTNQVGYSYYRVLPQDILVGFLTHVVQLTSLHLWGLFS